MQQRLGDGDDVFKIVRCTTKSLINKVFKIETDGGEKTLEFVKTFILCNTMFLTVYL